MHPSSKRRRIAAGEMQLSLRRMLVALKASAAQRRR